MAICGDSIVCAPEQGWPEDVALGLTDAPEAALACTWAEHSKVQLVMCSDEVHAVDWDKFRSAMAPLWLSHRAHMANYFRQDRAVGRRDGATRGQVAAVPHGEH